MPKRKTKRVSGYTKPRTQNKARKTSTALDVNKSTLINLPPEVMSDHGIRTEFSARLMGPNESAEEQVTTNLPRHRAYTILGFLGKNSFETRSVNAVFDPNIGDSYLAFEDKGDVKTFTHLHGISKLHCNQKQEFSLIEYKCTAASYAEAKSFFHGDVTKLLDTLSFLLDLPIHLNTINCTDLEDGTSYQTFTCGHVHKYVDIKAFNVPDVFRPVLALFREAKNSNSPFYAVICYYKIIEGYFNVLLPELRKKATSEKISLVSDKCLVPLDIHVVEELKVYLGKSLKEFYDNVLTPEYRNNIVHFLDRGNKESAPFNVSDHVLSSKFTGILILLKECSRVVIDSYINTHNELVEKRAYAQKKH